MSPELKKALTELREMEGIEAGCVIQWDDGDEQRTFYLCHSEVVDRPRWIEVVA